MMIDYMEDSLFMELLQEGYLQQNQMSEQNKEVVTSTSKKLQQQGYTPCGICQK